MPRTVLVVHDGQGPIRGSERVLLTLFDGIDPARYRFAVLTNHEALADACRARGIATEHVPFRALFASWPRPRDLVDLVRYAARAVRLVRAHDAVLLHANTATACSWLFLAALWCRVPLLAHIHNHWNRRLQLLCGMHTADAIVGVSERVVRNFRGDPVAAGRIRVVYAGFDGLTAAPADREQARAAFGIGTAQVVVALIGYLVALKRADIAIAAMRALPPDVAARTVLMVVGDGPERSHLERLASGLTVIFAGQRDDVHHLLRNVIDIVVLPSDSEAFGLVLLEAAAAGLPRIGSNAGGIPEAIRHEVDGLIVPACDVAALAVAVATLVRDPALARQYGTAAEARLRSEFDVTGFLSRFLGVYEELICAPASSRWLRIGQALLSIWWQATSRAFAVTHAPPMSP
jgi:glycosyltransferase involved in cell wall biosynthesis